MFDGINAQGQVTHSERLAMRETKDGPHGMQPTVRRAREPRGCLTSGNFRSPTKNNLHLHPGVTEHGN